MQVTRSTLMAGMMILPLLGGCSLEAAMTTCADCGEVRSVKARVARSEIRLLTDAPRAVISDADAADLPLVYDVRVRMDRGGSRDFVLAAPPGLKPGDRVEIRAGSVVTKLPTGHRYS
ncbi:MAG TPA: hypothetical protein VM240_13240 [Verrucomicrobiae bacterium]|nr:hypothetical protein [Verrucomicrobiae bacterium]